MKNENSFFGKLFYYSAAQGVLARAFNEMYDPFLVHMHMILQVSHATIQGKAMEIERGIEKAIKIDKNLCNALEQALEELVYNIENSLDEYKALIKITNITYSVIGNGFYLLKNGVPLLDSFHELNS